MLSPATIHTTADKKRRQVQSQLMAAGFSKWGLSKSEAQYLPNLIGNNEQIQAAVYGHSDRGSIMLIATDKRIIYLDTKPMFVKAEDISYDMVGGITFEWVLYHGVVVLHTRLGNFRVRTMNRRAAQNFRNIVQSRCVVHSSQKFTNY